MTELPPEWKAKLDAAAAPKLIVQVTNLAEIPPMKMPFLWYPYLPLGRVVIVAGAPGHGKSQFAALIAAMATRGQLFPGDVKEPSRVLMLCAEDDLATTIVPRLMAVNADLRLIDTINVVTEYPSGLTVEGLIRIPTDAEVIHEWTKAHVDARLIVLDPVASFFDRGHNMLFNQDTRDALGPLVAVAKTYGVTIVIILHLNKSESKDFANRIAESHGFQALARSVMALGPHPDDPDRERGAQKVIALTKANLVRPGNYGLRCEVRSVTLPGHTPPIETSELVLLGRCEISADDLLLSTAERSSRLETGEWLEAFLGDGWRRVADVRKAGVSDGYNWRAIDRVARAKGFQRLKQPGVEHGPWWLGAPQASARDLPGTGNLENLENQGTQGSQGAPGEGSKNEGQDSQGSRYPEDPRARDGNGFDLDAYREWERKKLGERDEDEP
jgi:hypothetical protein